MWVISHLRLKCFVSHMRLVNANHVRFCIAHVCNVERKCQLTSANVQSVNPVLLLAVASCLVARALLTTVTVCVKNLRMHVALK